MFNGSLMDGIFRRVFVVFFPALRKLLSPRVLPQTTMLLGAMGIHSSRIGVKGSLDKMAVQDLMSALAESI